MPTPDELERMARTAGEIMGAGDTSKTEAAVGKLVTELRHRNEDLVPGRIVHLVDQKANRCLAAIIVTPLDTGDAELHVFLPGYGPSSSLGHGVYRRDDRGLDASWHFSIECAKVMAR